MSTYTIVAIDPGWLNTGWVVIQNGKPVDAGVIVNDNSRAKRRTRTERTRDIMTDVMAVLDMYKPDVVVYERNLGSLSVRAATAMRAAYTIVVSALTALGYDNDRCFELTPQAVRKHITGKGNGTPKHLLNEWIRARPSFGMLTTVLTDQGICNSKMEHALDAALLGYVAVRMEEVRALLP